jgi:ABC-type multidrug transport system fused ATPase/permease subunit
MLKMPEIFLLDEATSGLDAASEFNIQRILEREITHRGPTVLIITHKLPTLKNITDKIILLRQGRIYKIGTYEELEDDEVFQDLLMK